MAEHEEHEELEYENASLDGDNEEEEDVGSDDGSGDEEEDGEEDEEDGSQQPRSHRETMMLDADDLLHPLEVKVEQLAQEITMADPPLLDDELSTKLNMYVLLPSASFTSAS